MGVFVIDYVKKVNPEINYVEKRLTTSRIDSGFTKRLVALLGADQRGQEEIAEAIGITPAALSKLKNGKNQPLPVVLRAIAREYGVTPEWLAFGKKPKSVGHPPISQAERTHLEAWRKLPAQAREHITGLMGLFAIAEPATAQVNAGTASATVTPPLADVIPLAARVSTPDERSNLRPSAHRTAPLLGYAAAGTPWPDEPLNDEEEIPVGLWFEGCVVLRCRGDSMIEEGILDQDLLICAPVELGGYRKGQRVIACVNGAMVVKRYGGQGRAASPKLSRGVIRLKSANPEVDDITGRLGEEIEVRAVVRYVHREE